MKAPENLPRRSLLQHWHERHRGCREVRGATCVVARYADGEGEEERAALAGITDLSTHPRCGFKGRGAMDWLRKKFAALPRAANEAVIDTTGCILARLSRDEVLLLDDLTLGSEQSATVLREHGGERVDHVYPLPRADSHACLALSGVRAAAVLSRVCAVDLRPAVFAAGSVAQTSIARVNGIVLRHPATAAPCYLLLCDISYTEYLWTSLLVLAEEEGGGAVGLDALLTYCGAVPPPVPAGSRENQS